MALDKDLLEILCCPQCKGSLMVEPEEQGFICEACRLRYPVVEGIPNFLIEEAQPLDISKQGPPAAGPSKP